MLTPALRILLVDDHAVYRTGLRTLLSDEGFQIVGEAGDARSTYLEDERTTPDLALVDFWLPGSDGVSVLRELRRRNRERKIAMLSASATPPLIVEALQAGAAGFLLKSQSVPELVAGVRAIAKGQTYLPPEVAQLVLAHRSRLEQRKGERHFDLLSAREKEVFRMLVRGKSNTEIAHELCISIKTVETHRERILRKLDLHSLADLVRYAAKENLLDA